MPARTINLTAPDDRHLQGHLIYQDRARRDGHRANNQINGNSARASRARSISRTSSCSINGTSGIDDPPACSSSPGRVDFHRQRRASPTPARRLRRRHALRRAAREAGRMMQRFATSAATSAAPRSSSWRWSRRSWRDADRHGRHQPRLFGQAAARAGRPARDRKGHADDQTQSTSYDTLKPRRSVPRRPPATTSVTVERRHRRLLAGMRRRAADRLRHELHRRRRPMPATSRSRSPKTFTPMFARSISGRQQRRHLSP